MNYSIKLLLTKKLIELFYIQKVKFKDLQFVVIFFLKQFYMFFFAI